MDGRDGVERRARRVLPVPRSRRGSIPIPTQIEKLITPRTRAIVVINPNNPTGAVYSRDVLEALARIAERHNLVVFSDEIYDQMLYDGAEFVPMATLCRDTLCATFSGLSKVYRACGYRVGWVSFSGAVRSRGAIHECARSARGAASLQQRARAVGRANGARRLPEHRQAVLAGRPAVSVARRRSSTASRAVAS